MSNLRIGLPSKGRLAEESVSIFERAGIKFRRQNRSLFAKVKGMPIEIIFLRGSDIPLLCAEGALDMGLTGSDSVQEAAVDLDIRLRLGIGRCRMSICVPADSPFQSVSDLDGKRIATSFPEIAHRYFKANGATPHLVSLSGSVEIMISLGVADAIVDLVETGSTLVANKLKVLEDIDSYEVVLLQNNAVRDPEIADIITRRLEGVVISNSWSLLEYNVPAKSIEQAKKITPGFKSPTVAKLEDPEWYAIRVMVKRKNLNEVMDSLEQIGATAILETQINNCRL
ncbi:MAG: ATP phosphoribosyltransferase [Verrucomicrobiota bacterium]